MPIKLIDLSRTISHALRHEPWLYELEMDKEGWVSVEQLLEAIRCSNDAWGAISQATVEEMIRTAPKSRHEIRDGRIRAIYGHSIPAKLTRIAAPPPRQLFHGTSPSVVATIKAEGLRPMTRQNVHLSTDEATALEVGKRKSKLPVLLLVRSLEASEKGVTFFKGNDKVWLADAIPPVFIDFPTE